jgi:hypothetical protein
MPDVLTALTSFAVRAFRESGDGSYQPDAIEAAISTFSALDPVIAEAQRQWITLAARHLPLEDTVNLVFGEPELAALAHQEGTLNPMVLYPGGGSRIGPGLLITGLLSSAFLQMYYLGLPHEEGTFVRAVLEGFEELKRATRGERVRAYAISGVARITLSERRQISTPWGIIRAAPQAPEPRFPSFGRPRTTCIFAEPRLLRVVFDRAASPTSPFEPSEISPERPKVLFPLACALGSADTSKPAAPFVTWSTFLLPFLPGTNFSIPTPPPSLTADVSLDERTFQVEEWAGILDRAHIPSLDTAARRLVSAVANRVDPSDSLIDAVMVWENLVGTSSEVTFRVTAALAKMLEPEPTKRHAIRKRLVEIYGIRSRVVHGAAANLSEVDKARSEAVDIAVRALQAAYRRGSDWLALTSDQRAEAILLEWQ